MEEETKRKKSLVFAAHLQLVLNNLHQKPSDNCHQLLFHSTGATRRLVADLAAIRLSGL